MYLNNDESTSGTLPRLRRPFDDDGDAAVDISVEAAEAAAVAAFRVDGVNDDDDGPPEDDDDDDEEEVGGFIGSLLRCGCDGESFFPPGGCGVNAASELRADVNNNETETDHEIDASNVTVVTRRAAAVVENTAPVPDVVAGGGIAVHDDDDEGDDSDKANVRGGGGGDDDDDGNTDEGDNDDEDRDPPLRLLSLLVILILLKQKIGRTYLLQYFWFTHGEM